MGLGKVLHHGSSFGTASSSTSRAHLSSRASSAAGGEGASGGGVDVSGSVSSSGGLGSTGWQAPELLRMIAPGAAGGEELKPSDAPPAERLSRAVDVFSLGCLFHFVVENGRHPFGEWHERHANVMKGRRDITSLEPRSPELHDLVRRCTEQKPGARPAAKDVVQHPFFWDAVKRVRFLAAVSDRLLLAKDLSTAAQREQRQRGAALLQRLGLARGVVPRGGAATTAASSGWSAHFDESLFESTGGGKRRARYDFSSTCDALRFLRNKWAHSMELEARAKALLGESAASFLAYFTAPARLSGLVLMCYRVVQLAFPDDAAFVSFGVVAASVAELNAAAPSPPLLDSAALFSASTAHAPPRRLDAAAGAGDAPSAGRSRGKRGKRGKEACEARRTTPSSRLKTKLCRDWRNGACARGDACGFAHGAAELRG